MFEFNVARMMDACSGWLGRRRFYQLALVRNESVEPCNLMGGRFKVPGARIGEKVTLTLLFGSVLMHYHNPGLMTPFLLSCKGFVRLTPRLPDAGYQRLMCRHRRGSSCLRGSIISKQSLDISSMPAMYLLAPTCSSEMVVLREDRREARVRGACLRLLPPLLPPVAVVGVGSSGRRSLVPLPLASGGHRRLGA